IASSKTPEGRCTNGFNMRGSNGWVYTSTAGHCMAGASNVTSNDGRWIGYCTGGSYFNTSYPYDHSVLPFLVIGSTNYATFWQPKNWVISGSNTSFPITGIHTYSQIANSWVACASGTMTGTTCGTVQGKDGGIIMNICQHHGDSSAPLFSQIDHTAYGLSIKDTTTDDSCPSGYRSYYTPISNIIEDRPCVGSPNSRADCRCGSAGRPAAAKLFSPDNQAATVPASGGVDRAARPIRRRPGCGSRHPTVARRTAR
ncbi:MAG TPA: hypothetical protein VF892_22030, partial [Pseudonocardiaceae bacterium]